MKTLSLRCHHVYLNSLLCLGLLGITHSSFAADEVLVQGLGVSISSQQASTELLSLPPDARANVVNDPVRFREWLDTVYLRKALAAEAEAQNLAQKSAVQFQLQFAREGILANARLTEVEDAARPPMATLDAQARAQYTAERERFHLPAQTRASHILVKGNEDVSRVKAQQLLEQLKAGSSFDELAQKHSEDPGSASRGGSLGWFSAGRMVAEFDSAIAQMKNPGDLSSLVKTQFGYHIIRLDERKPAQVQPFEAVRDQLIAPIVQQLRAKTRETEFKRVGDSAKMDPKVLEVFRTKESQRLSPQGPAVTSK